MSSLYVFSLSDIQSLLMEEGELQLNLPNFHIKLSDIAQVSNYFINECLTCNALLCHFKYAKLIQYIYVLLKET